MTVLKVFGDESADGSGKRVFALGALIGADAEWDLAVADWLSLTGGAEIHANEFETQFVNDSDRSKHPQRLREYAALVQVLAESDLAGFSIAMDVVAYREEIAFIHVDNAYFKCFTDLLEILADLTRRWNNSNPDESIQTQLTLDRKQGTGTIEALYNAFVGQPEWRGSNVMSSSISFDTRANPRIQMADLFAREAMKDMERIITGRSDTPRGSKQALSAIPKKFNFIQYPRDYWRNWAANVEGLRQQEGFEKDDYSKWLLETGRVQDGIPADNPTNRFGYFAWRDSNQTRSES